MLFQVIHTHSAEDCPARSPEQLKPISAWWQALKKNPDVKVISGSVSPLDHTFYITVEAEDNMTLTRALGALASIGTGEVIPILMMDQAFSIAESGALRAKK
jgi:hypothetical protein